VGALLLDFKLNSNSPQVPRAPSLLAALVRLCLVPITRGVRAWLRSVGHQMQIGARCGALPTMAALRVAEGLGLLRAARVSWRQRHR
jgi:hypothetical protein